jgi:predicted DNA-binding protein with PD1-like motif
MGPSHVSVSSVMGGVLLVCSAAACQHDGAVAHYSVQPALESGKASGMKIQRLNDDGHERHYAVIFSPGDDVLDGLSEFARREEVGAAQITGIGGIHDGLLGWYDRDRKMFREIAIDQQAEVISLVGDIALMADQPAAHVHMAVALADGSTRGGHLLRATVWPTLEVMITESPRALHKQHDMDTGIDRIVAEGEAMSP